MKAIGSNILLDDCERKVVISGDLAISYDEMDRMNLALMKIRHPNLAVDDLQNVMQESDGCFGVLSERRKENV